MEMKSRPHSFLSYSALDTVGWSATPVILTAVVADDSSCRLSKKVSQGPGQSALLGYEETIIKTPFSIRQTAVSYEGGGNLCFHLWHRDSAMLVRQPTVFRLTACVMQELMRAPLQFRRARRKFRRALRKLEHFRVVAVVWCPHLRLVRGTVCCM